MKRWAVVVALVVVGCDPLPPRTNVVETRYYSITPEISVDQYSTLPLSLGIRPLDYARVYKERIVYREFAHELKRYDFDEWTELPRDAVTRAILDALRQTQRFEDVGDAIEMRAPDLILTGELRIFEEVRTESPSHAHVEVQLNLRKSIGVRGQEALWSEVLSAKVPVPRDDRGGVAEAMSEAVAQIAQQAATAIAGIEV